MEYGHVKLLAHVALDLALKAVEHGVAKRARRDHCLGTIGLSGLNVRPGDLDRDALVVGRGVEAAAFGAAAVVDRATAEDLGEMFERDVVARIDELVALR